MARSSSANFLDVAPMTALFLTLCVAFHAFLWIKSAQDDERYGPEARTPSIEIAQIRSEVLQQSGASSRQGVWDGGWHRFFLPMFMHAGLIHILFNIFALYRLSPGLELHLGSSNFGTVYLMSGLGGTCFSLIFGGHISAGASGAVFGLMGATLGVKLALCAGLRRALKNSEIRQTAWYVLLNFLVCFMLPNVDHWNHLGGLLLGLLYGLLFEYSRNHQRVGLALVLGLTALSVVLMLSVRWMVFNPHYHVYLGLRAERNDDEAGADLHFDTARRWAKRWRSEAAGREIGQALMKGAVPRERLMFYVRLLRDVGSTKQAQVFAELELDREI